MLASTQSNFPIQLFHDELQRNMTILVLTIFTAVRAGSGGHFVKIETLSKKRQSRGRGGQQEDFHSNGIEVD